MKLSKRQIYWLATIGRDSRGNAFVSLKNNGTYNPYSSDQRTFVSHHAFPADDLPKLIKKVADGLVGIVTPEPEPIVELVPAVPVKRRFTDTHVICLDDGKKFRSMRRHLATLGLTPEQYRERWNLPKDDPIVHPSYSEQRSKMAKDHGLGKKH